MTKKVLITVGVILLVVLVWIVLMAFSPIHHTNKTFNIATSMLVPSAACSLTVALSYYLSPSKKITMGLLAIIIGVVIGYPVYGPGTMFDSIFTYDVYGYLPSVCMLATGFFTLFWCWKNSI